MHMKLKLLTLAVYLWLVILLFSGCQTKEPLTAPSEDMIRILQTNYYLRLPAGYQFNPFLGDANNKSHLSLTTIQYPVSHPQIGILAASFGGLVYDSSTGSNYERKPENFDEHFLPPEQISSDPLSIYLAKYYVFEEDQEGQILAQGNVGQNIDGEGDGLVIRVFGAFSQQEEGYQVLKELLQSITYIAPTPEP